ncbi:MAG: hypothetical protein WBD55_00140 [Dehalococcoidia bacterium]
MSTPQPPFTWRRNALVSITCAAVVGALLLAACGGGGGGGSLTDRLLLERDTGIALLNLATGNEQLLMSNPKEAFFVDPAVSPDGMRIAYANRLAPFVEADEPADLGADLYVAKIDGTSPELLVKHSVANEELRGPAWLPDGKSLLYVRQRIEVRSNQPFLVRSIERLDLTTKQSTEIVASGFQPTVCSDGQRVAYVNDDFLVMTMWTVNIDGSNPQTIGGPDDGFSWLNSPRFSPDCDRLAFGGAEIPEDQTSAQPAPRYAALRSATMSASSATVAAYNGLPEDIWVLNVGSGEFMNVADLDLDLPNLTWSGDGQRIFVLASGGLFDVDPKGGSKNIGEGTFHGHVEWLDDGSAAP